MVNELFNVVSTVCQILNKHKVEYLIIGGTAVGFYGHYRVTQAGINNPNSLHDIDIWYNPTLSNYNKLLKGLSDIGFDITSY